MNATDIVRKYQAGNSLRSISAETGICTATIRRILITEGVELCDCPSAEQILIMYQKGMCVEDIATALNISVKTVRTYTPFEKGSYSVGDKSANALRIRACRERKSQKQFNQ